MYFPKGFLPHHDVTILVFPDFYNFTKSLRFLAENSFYVAQGKYIIKLRAASKWIKLILDGSSKNLLRPTAYSEGENWVKSFR